MIEVPDSTYLQVYKASAGSGKTFTLTVQYIKQLIEHPKAYQQILAVTFTNKATAEMKGRILSQLYGIAHQLDSSKGYLKALVQETGYTELAIQQTAKEALSYIIHDYSRFRIETIDSFFQAVIRNLARELELGHQFNVELGIETPISDAVDVMLERLDEKSPELYYLIKYVEEQMESNKAWNVLNAIKRFSKNLFDEHYIKNGDELREKLQKDPHFLYTYKTKLLKLKKEWIERSEAIGEEFYNILEREGLSEDSFAYGKNGVASFFRKMKDISALMKDSYSRFYDNFTMSNRVKEMSTDAEKWVSKKSADREHIVSLAAETLIPLLLRAEEHRKSALYMLSSIDLALKHLNDLGLLNAISEELHRQNNLQGRFLLADTNRLLSELMREGDASFIYEKIGTAIDRVMIDEFQDTSMLQWENFRILLEECIAKAKGSLVVGDVKQSIYRWRGGDWKVLSGIKNIPSLRAQVQTLTHNWRSEKRIIAFNNSFFTRACDKLNEQWKAMIGEDCLPLIDAYSDVVQACVREEEHGYVKIIKSAAEDYEAYTQESLLKEIQYLFSIGVKENDIAILFRKRKHVVAVATYLKEHLDCRIVSDEAFQLDASSGLCLIIDALRYLSSPQDRYSLAMLALSYQQLWHLTPIEEQTILQGEISTFLPVGFMEAINTLKVLPLYELVETLYRIFGLERLTEETAYFCTFYDYLNEFIQKRGSDITLFLKEWEDRIHTEKVPSGDINGLRLLTIHKSKGLEFHTVLLPFCDWSLEVENGQQPLLWCEMEKESDGSLNEVQLLPITYSKLMGKSMFQSRYKEELLQLWVDNLNILYVAFTRACKNLIIWTRGNEKQKDGMSTVGDLISVVQKDMQDIIWEEVETAEEIETVFSYGSPAISVKKKEEKEENRLSEIPTSIELSIEAHAPQIAFLQSKSAESYLTEEESNEYIAIGGLLHRIFSQIKTIEDVDAVLEKMTLEGVIEGNDQKNKLKQILNRALRTEKAKEWFSPHWRLYNECAILYKNAAGEVERRIPDRVMIGKNRTIVVDFKFGNPKENYEEQVRHYMKLLKQMSFPQVEGYIWYVYKDSVVQVGV